MGWDLFKRYKIKKWSKRLNLIHHEQVFQSLFASVNGFVLSKQARLTGDAFEYTYGEISFLGFIALIGLARPDSNTVFYDLGSGTGKAVLACAMVYDVKKSCGIELFEALHEAALTQQDRLSHQSGYEVQVKKIQFILGDFLSTVFDDATLIFIHATALFGQSWDVLLTRLAALQSGTKVIVISKKLKLQRFMLLRSTEVMMSWGVATAYLYEAM